MKQRIICLIMFYFLRLAYTCKETCESAWAPKASLYASSTCVHCDYLTVRLARDLNRNFLEIPTGGSLTSYWLFTKRGAVEFGATKHNPYPSSGREKDFNSGPQDYKSNAFNHWATLLRIKKNLLSSKTNAKCNTSLSTQTGTSIPVPRALIIICAKMERNKAANDVLDRPSSSTSFVVSLTAMQIM